MPGKKFKGERGGRKKPYYGKPIARKKRKLQATRNKGKAALKQGNVLKAKRLKKKELRLKK